MLARTPGGAPSRRARNPSRAENPGTPRPGGPIVPGAPHRAIDLGLRALHCVRRRELAQRSLRDGVPDDVGELAPLGDRGEVRGGARFEHLPGDIQELAISVVVLLPVLRMVHHAPACGRDVGGLERDLKQHALARCPLEELPSGLLVLRILGDRDPVL